MKKRSLVVLIALTALGATGCFSRASTPPRAIDGPFSGGAPADFLDDKACGSWASATGDEAGRSHVSFPEIGRDASCYVPVRYGPDGPRADAAPDACLYRGDEATLARLELEAARDEAIARGEPVTPLPLELACALPDEVRREVALHNGGVVRKLASRLRAGRAFAYSAVATFGYGHPLHGHERLASFRPDDACAPLTKRQMDELSINVDRAFRAAQIVARDIAPVAILSGGAVHSRSYEAFALLHVATCTLGLRRDRVLLDPCANHTHTNLRNTGALVLGIGGRRAYVVTDDGLQAAYLQEWTSFDVIGGSIDQRSLRDWGYLLGSWRQASVGMDAGFWYTPYRFWSDPNPARRSFTCLGP